MKKLIILLVVLALAVSSVPAFAAKAGVKGASASAYEHASDEAVFHRVGDWFATRGKSGAEKQAILTERKAKRAAKRAEKEARKQQRAMEKQTKKFQKKMGESMKGMKKGFGKK